VLSVELLTMQCSTLVHCILARKWIYSPSASQRTSDGDVQEIRDKASQDDIPRADAMHSFIRCSFLQLTSPALCFSLYSQTSLVPLSNPRLKTLASSLLIQVVDQIYHLRMAHGRAHSSIPFVQNPHGKHDPETIKCKEVEPSASQKLVGVPGGKTGRGQARQQDAGNRHRSGNGDLHGGPWGANAGTAGRDACNRAAVGRDGGVVERSV
jgi:hypothetical protein